MIKSSSPIVLPHFTEIDGEADESNRESNVRRLPSFNFRSDN